MSKRWGRQKKRQAKAKIMGLQYAVGLLRNQKDELEGAVRACSEVLGDNFIGLPAKTVSATVSGSHALVYGHELSSSSAFMSPKDVAEDLTRKAYHIGALKAGVQGSNPYERDLHFYASHPETGKVAYCISKKSMQKLPRKVLIENISKAMAEQFVADLA